VRHVFVSCDRGDAEFADILAVTLREHGFNTWRGPESDQSGAGHGNVDIAIREALAVIAILSPPSMRSPSVNYEWAFALGSGVPVLPLLLSAAERDLHPRLRTLQYLDFTNRSAQPWDSLTQSLRRLQGAESPATVHVPRDAPPVIQLAARTLDGADEKDRVRALSSLGQMNHPAAIEVLAEAVRHPLQQVRFGAAIHLAATRDLRAIPALLDGLRSRWPDIEPRMLGDIGSPAVPALIEALEDLSDAVQDAAASQLGRIGGREAIAALTARLRDPDASKRCEAAVGLKYAADPSAIPALLELVKDPAREVRRDLAHALAKCVARTANYQSVLPAFLDLLEDEYDQVAVAVVDSLAKSGDPTALAALVRAYVTAKDENVRAFARSALVTLGAAAAPAIREAIPHADPLALARTIDLLGYIHEECDFPLFIDATRHADRGVRRAAVLALRDKRAQAAIPVLLERFHDEAETLDICESVVQTLGAIGDPRAVPALVECLDDEGLEESAAGALRNIGGKEARAALKAWKNRQK